MTGGLGIAIVTHGSEAVIGPCLDACLRAPGAAVPVVVVDNASVDATTAVVRSRGAVRLIANPENRGFAAAANQGIAACGTELVLLLNPDAVPAGDLEPLAEACREPAVGAAGGRLLDADGNTQRGFQVRRLPTPITLVFETLGLNRLWPGNPVNRRYRCLDLDPARAADVEQPAGAFLLVRRDAWQAVGGFDEGFYPLWFEDVDFCRRLLAAGYRIRYVPQSAARHLGGHSIPALGWERRQLYWYANLLRYAARHYGRPARAALCGAVATGVFARTVSRVLVLRSLKPIGVYGKVIRLAARCLFKGGAAVSVSWAEAERIWDDAGSGMRSTPHGA